MNKTILIAGGTAAVSLAVGTAGGYFIAKKRFNKQLDEAIAREAEAAKTYYEKRYSVMLMQAREKPDSPEELTQQRGDDPETVEPEPEEEELSEADRKAIERGRQKLIRDASKALVDYNGISTKIVVETQTPVSTVVQHNVFDDNPPKEEPKPRELPPRGPGGAFRKKTQRELENEPPQIIDEEAFLLNDPGNNQESVLYFINDKTAVLEADPSETVDISVLGEVNLTLFPDVPDGLPSTIWVRNTGLSTDYEIKKMTESLTDYIGLGEESDDEEYEGSDYL